MVSAERGEAQGAIAVDIAQDDLRRQAAENLGEDLSYIDGWHINHITLEGFIDAEVPIPIIKADDVTVDPATVDDLVEKFNEHEAEFGGTGQRDPGVLGHVPGEGNPLIDGFHRKRTQEVRGKPTLHVIVRPRMTYEEVVKLRLEYAAKHTSIVLPRQVEWVQSAWDRTPWAKKIPNVLTAFRAIKPDYADFRTPDVKDIDALSNADYDAICAWTKDMCRAWKLKPDDVRKNLSLADGLAPDLLKLVYQRKGSPPAGRLGTGHVEAILETYAGEEDIQRVIVQSVFNFGLTIRETKHFIDAVEEHYPQTAADVSQAIEEIDIRHIRSLARSSGGGSGGGGSGGGASTKPASLRDLPDGELLQALNARLDGTNGDMYPEGWQAPDILAALHSLAQMSRLAIKALNGSRADGELSTTVVAQAAEMLGRASARLSAFVEEAPLTPAETNRKEHSSWGLDFKVYEGDTPSLMLNGKTMFGVDELITGMLFVVAGEKPGLTLELGDIKNRMIEMGYVFSETGTDKALKQALNSMEALLKQEGLEGHLVIRTGGQRKVHVALISAKK